ncbi:MAG: terpene cyclase/mutase family protein [Planctomycetes bacterium]|nr:terpene cyclase/mutase family protein [Planctomycetota bacterium]
MSLDFLGELVMATFCMFVMMGVLPLQAPMDQAELQNQAEVLPEQDLSERVDTAILRGVEFLLPRQYADGSWRMAGQEKYTGGTTALACYSLYKAGLPKKHAAIQLSLNFLERDQPVHIYDAALRVLLLTSLDREKYATRIRRAAAILNYGPRQYFTYTVDAGRGATGDLSNHQYGLVGLEALDRNGFETSQEHWIHAAEFLIRQADPGGGWGYFPQQQPSPTMVLSGIASAACCLQTLQRHGWKPKLQNQLEEVLHAAMVKAETDWFLDRPMDIAPLNRWFFYGCYGVERAMAILGEKQLGNLDWYTLIAEAILAKQKNNGAWSSAKGEPEMNTAFALLTLSKATASTGSAAVDAVAWEYKWQSDGQDTPIRMTATGAPTCSVFLSNFDPEWFEEQTWLDEQSPRLHSVEWMLDGKVVAAVRRDVEEVNQQSVQAVPFRFPAQFPLPGNGQFELLARLNFHEPDCSIDDLQTVESVPLQITVSGLLDRRVQYEMEVRNQLVVVETDPRQLELQTSSAIGGESGAYWAFDRCHATAWRWQAKDPHRHLVAKWKKPFKASSIRIITALPADQSLDSYNMPIAVKLKVNGGKALELTFSAKEWQEGHIFSFRKSQKIRKIEVEVTSLLNGRSSGSGGISEIEFLNQ